MSMPTQTREPDVAADQEVRRFTVNVSQEAIDDLRRRIGYGLTDSPAGLAAFMLVHGGFA